MNAAPAPGGFGLRALSLLLLAILIWGSTWTAIRYQLGVTDPGWSVAFRFLIATLAIGAYARWEGVSLGIGAADLPLLAAVGLMQFTLNFLLIYHAEAYVTSGLVAMIFALLIIPNAVLGRLFLGHRFGAGFIFGSLLAMAGMALLFRQEITAATAGGGRAALGIGLSLLAMLSASAGNLLQSSGRAARLPGASLLFWGMGFGALINIVLALILSGAPVIDPRPSYWLSTLYLALFGSAITFPVYLSLMRQIGPARAAYTSVLIPIVAMLFSTVLENYHWGPSAIAGSVLALAGLVFALRGKAAA